MKILDFGLAKLLDDTDDSSQSTIHRTDLTEVGVPYGTATYAAPEQARGDRVDKRADIFSTGVLLYEMLTGTWPFRGKTTIDVRHAVLHDAPVPVAELRKEPIPARLQQILDRCWRKSRAIVIRRWMSCATICAVCCRKSRRAARRRLYQCAARTARHLGGASPCLARDALAERQVADRIRLPRLALTTPTKPTIHETPSTTIADPEKKSLAILPFRNLSNDPASSFYEFALADAVITELARVRSLVVRPSSVIAKYQGQQVDPRDVGHDLRVERRAAARVHSCGRALPRHRATA